ncbi:MAG: hypothetical protein GX241_06930 [Ruminococcaceae bacterium]|nr:hypothetical protein [Oscillospiraceae bacterium]
MNMLKTKGSISKKKILAAVLLLLTIAYIPSSLLWVFKFRSPEFFFYLRPLIHIFLAVCWGISVRIRIVQVQVQKFMIFVSGLIVFWILIKEIKHKFVEDPDITRDLWYAFYIPMVLIVTFFLIIALSLGKPENYRLPKWTNVLIFISVALIILVLTNDLHEKVFSFPGEPGSGAYYEYEIGYWMILAWAGLLVFSAISIIVLKCRLPYSKGVIWLPFIPISFAVIYVVLYINDWHAVDLIAKDMTTVFCVLTIAVLESCIQSGLIQNNTNYRELMTASSIGAQITDEKFNVKYSADNAIEVDSSTLEAATETPVLLEEGIRISAFPIENGYVFWQEDVSALSTTLTELYNAGEELKDYGVILQEETYQKARQKKLEERKRLFETMQQKTASQVKTLINLAEKLEVAEDENVAKEISAKMAIIGAYLKRRSNLVFLTELQDVDPIMELELSLRESTTSLKFYGVNCAYSVDEKAEINLADVALFYDFFEEIVELSLENLLGITAYLNSTASGSSFSLVVNTSSDLNPLKSRFPDAFVSREDEVWYCSLNGKEEAEND